MLLSCGSVIKPEELTGVYFGPEISQAAMEIVCLILRGQNETVAFWEGTRSTSNFKVGFTRFDYLSYLHAKTARILADRNIWLGQVSGASSNASRAKYPIATSWRDLRMLPVRWSPWRYQTFW